MQHAYYLLSLIIALTGLALTDYRYKLAFWYDASRTAWTLAAATFVFIIWDGIGIWAGIFYKGSSQYMLPFVIAPEFPLEELFFLTVLTYVTLLFYRGFSRWQRIS